jgi:dihydrolipoamide dehydrogenase
LAHKASAEAKGAAEAMCGEAVSFDHYIPSVIFSDPEIASVGLTEAQAMERDLEVKTGQFSFAVLGRALASEATDGFVKVVSDATSRRLLGIQIVGAHASELIATATHALEMGALADDLLPIINAHPTFSEAIGEAVESIYGKAIHISPRKQKKT